MTDHNHEHDHNHDHDQEERDIIIIPDEDGNEEQFEVFYEFTVESTGNHYVMLIPVDGDPESDEIYPFRIEEDGEDDLQLYVIEDDEEWKIVEETFNTLMAEFED